MINSRHVFKEFSFYSNRSKARTVGSALQLCPRDLKRVHVFLTEKQIQLKHMYTRNLPHAIAAVLMAQLGMCLT